MGLRLSWTPLSCFDWTLLKGKALVVPICLFPGLGMQQVLSKNIQLAGSLQTTVADLEGMVLLIQVRAGAPPGCGINSAFSPGQSILGTHTRLH